MDGRLWLLLPLASISFWTVSNWSWHHGQAAHRKSAPEAFPFANFFSVSVMDRSSLTPSNGAPQHSVFMDQSTLSAPVTSTSSSNTTGETGSPNCITCLALQTE